MSETKLMQVTPFLDKVVRRTLSNGLRVWVLPRPETRTVAMLAQVPVGSRHETVANNGISHFVEHMVFTGTAKWNETEVMDIIRRLGGEANARTGSEDTIYWLKLKSSDLPIGIEWFSEVLFRPRLDARKFEKERKVIITEKGGDFAGLERLFEWVSDKGWGWDVFRTARHWLWGKQTNIHYPVIGKDLSLNAMTHDDLVAFYKTHYVPNNIALMIVGDCDAEETLALVEKWLGEFPAGPHPESTVSPAVNEAGEVFRIKGPSVNEQGQLLITAALPGMFHPDRYALLILGDILDDVLQRELRYDQGLVYGIETYPSMYRDVGYFVVYTTALSEHFAEIRRAVMAHLVRVQAGKISERELREAKEALVGRALLSMESNSRLAWWLSEENLYTPDDDDIPDYLAHVNAVTCADVQQVANTYLSSDQLIEVEHTPGFTPKRARRPLAVIGLAMLVGAGWLGLRWLRKRRNTA